MCTTFSDSVLETLVTTAKWRTGNGEFVTPREMTDSHLWCASERINKVCCRGDKYQRFSNEEWLAMFVYELRRRQEGKTKQTDLEAKLLASKARLKERVALVAYLKEQLDEAEADVYGEENNIDYLEAELDNLAKC